MRNRSAGRVLLCTAMLTMLTCVAGCNSSWIDATVENQTGQTIRELEVDYPSASFGINALEQGAQMHYRFQIRGEGQVKLEYTPTCGKTVHAVGSSLTENQQGQLWMRLLPEGKVEFVPKLQPVS